MKPSLRFLLKQRNFANIQTLKLIQTPVFQFSINEDKPRKIITKEQMKKELMEGSHFETELLSRKSKSEAQQQKDLEQEKEREEKLSKEAAYQASLLTQEQINQTVEEMKQEGVKEYKIFEISEEKLKKIQSYKKLLFYVNLPLVFAIPILCEMGVLDHKPNVKQIYAILHLTDFFLCFNSVLIYTVVQRLVHSISYLPEEHKILVKQYSTKFLGLKELKFDPKDLIRSRGGFNPFIGYRSVQDQTLKLGTESMGKWHDRIFMDSIIFREVKRRVIRGKAAEFQEKQKSNESTKPEGDQTK
eukprot:403336292